MTDPSAGRPPPPGSRLPPELVAATLAAAAGAGAAIPLGRPLDTAAAAILAAGMAAIAVSDLRSFRVPDLVLAPLAVAGLAYAGLRQPTLALDLAVGIPGALIAAAAFAGLLLLIRELFFRLRGLDGLGRGDVKLAAVAGLWLGLDGFPYALVAGSVGALAFAAIRSLGRGAPPAERRLPLALFLAPAIFAVWLLMRYRYG